MVGWRKEKKFSLIFLICTGLMCIFFILPGEFIYRFIKNVNSIVFMGFYFGVFGVILLVGLCLAAIIEKQKIEPKAWGISAVCVIALVLAGMLFEFLYELGGEKIRIATDKYIFLIDNSGSMEENDPSQQRIAAVRRILENQEEDVQYAVYTFGMEVGCVREMGPISEGTEELEIAPGGQTPIVTMLRYLQQEFEDGALKEPESTQVILLTDGYATDNGWFGWKINRPLNYFSKKHIPVSTVGLGEADGQLLEKIADKTDGINVMVSDVEQLKEAMQSAIVRKDMSRNLLSYRESVAMPWLYVLMRILFITILGIIAMIEKLVIVNNTESQGLILFVSAIGSLAAGILLEVGINVLSMPETVMRLIAAVAMGITPAYVIKTNTYHPYSLDEDEFGEYGSYSGSGGMRVN